jgi:YHS domain-containing protein
MLSIIFATVMLALPQGQTDCPVMGSPAGSNDLFLYKGIVYSTCCPGCNVQFMSNPEKFLKKESSSIVGWSVFDVISKRPIDPETAKAHTEYAGIRYFFASEENRSKFDKNPKQYAQVPDKEYVEVVFENTVSWKDLKGYIEHNGARYYVCDDHCFDEFAKNPSEFAKNHKADKAKVYKFKMVRK